MKEQRTEETNGDDGFGVESMFRFRIRHGSKKPPPVSRILLGLMVLSLFGWWILMIIQRLQDLGLIKEFQ